MHPRRVGGDHVEQVEPDLAGRCGRWSRPARSARRPSRSRPASSRRPSCPRRRPRGRSRRRWCRRSARRTGTRPLAWTAASRSTKPGGHGLHQLLGASRRPRGRGHRLRPPASPVAWPPRRTRRPRRAGAAPRTSSSGTVRRLSATGRSGWPGDSNEASLPSGRLIRTSPVLVESTTSVMPGPCELCRSTSTLSRSASQATSRSALGLIRSAVTEADVHLLRVLVERGGEQRPPRRDPGPGQVGVALGVRRALLAERLRLGPARRGGVGDPALGQRPERVLGRVVGGVGGPPDGDGGVGEQQRQHHRLGVLDHLALEPDQRVLAAPAGAGRRPGR